MLDYNRNTAVLFIVFRSPNTTKKVFGQIKKVRPKRLYIAADGANNKDEQKACEETRSIIDVDWDCQIFKLYHEYNMGYDKHCYRAISWFFTQEKEGIILEDNCVPSLSFFGFCSVLLEKYRTDGRIGHIAGSNYQFGKKRGDGSYYFSNLTYVEGWATWRRVWQQCYSFENNYKNFKDSNFLSYMPAFAPFKYNWNEYFHIANNNKDVYWNFKYAYVNLVNNRLSIIPNKNLVRNIGSCHERRKIPFIGVLNEELYEINHPSLICPNIEADLYSQAQEYNIDFDSLVSKNDYLYLKDQFISCVKKNDIKIEIPRIIHQIYFDQSGPPAYLLDISQSWKELNPDWEYKFWNGNDVNSFIQEYYPELIPAYNSLRYDVQRWDAIRYLILYKMGGLYVDMDYECTETITPILCNTICAMGLEPNGHAIRIYKPYIVGNAFMATIPGHPYFKEIIDEVFYRKGQECLETDELVLNTTGPYMTTRLYDKSLYKDQITLIPSELIAPLTSRDVGNFLKGNKSLDFEAKIEKSFAVHYFLGSWTNQVNS